MILVFALAGTFAATIAAIGTLMMGQPWWMGLVSYITAGMLTVCFSAIFFVVAGKYAARKTEGRSLRTHLPLAEH